MSASPSGDFLAEMVAASAADSRVAFLDLAPWFAIAREKAGDVSFTVDGIHLSRAGAAVVADAFAAAIETHRGPTP